jgi:hypothetical protein
MSYRFGVPYGRFMPPTYATRAQQGLQPAMPGMPTSRPASPAVAPTTAPAVSVANKTPVAGQTPVMNPAVGINRRSRFKLR